MGRNSVEPVALFKKVLGMRDKLPKGVDVTIWHTTHSPNELIIDVGVNGHIRTIYKINTLTGEQAKRSLPNVESIVCDIYEELDKLVFSN